jgi:hypothetical protein
VSLPEENPLRAIRNAMDRLSKLATIRPLDAHDVDAELVIVERSVYAIELREHQAARALRMAVGTWCMDRDPGGDGADGETYRICEDARKALESK